MIRKSFTFEGRRYWIKAQTERECYEKMALKKRDLEEGRVIINESTTVKAWCTYWVETYKRPSVSKTWCGQLEGILKNHVYPTIGNLKVKDVKPIHLQKVINNMSGKSSSSIAKTKIVLNEIFRDAKNNNMILDNPAERIIEPKAADSKGRRALTAAERKLIEEVAEYSRGGLFVLIMLNCGLRPGEVIALQWRHVDLKNKNIKVEQSLKRDGEIGAPKTKAGNRIVPIPDDLVDRLTKMRGEPFSHVCTDTHGNKFNGTSIHRLWVSFVRDCNIKLGCAVYKNAIVPPYRFPGDITLYNFRHTYCTDLQAKGVPINVAKELMGHSNISTTAKIYTHWSEQSYENARDLINGKTSNCDGERDQN
ncbi:MAG: site-specific integrase, partial [Selenomonadaceae bacterium]